MNSREQCGARTVFWPDAECIEAECWLRVRHEGDHEDLILGTWERTDGE